MRKAIVLVSIICFHWGGYSQNTLDSINIKLEKIASYKEKIEFLFKVSDFYNNRRRDSAIFFYEKAMKIAKNNGDTSVQAKINYKLGIAYYEIGEYKKALKFDFLAYRQFEQLADNKGIAQALNEIGTMYDVLGDSIKAKKNLFKALKIRVNIKDTAGLFDSYNNIGVYYYYKNNYAKALRFYNKAYKIAPKHSVLNNIGEIYYETGDFENALKYFNKSLNLVLEKKNDSYVNAMLLMNIGMVYYKQKSFKNAIVKLKQSIDIAKKVNSKLLLKDIYNKLTEVYSEQNDYKNALKYNILNSNLKDTLFRGKQIKAIADMNAKYEISAKEKENEIQAQIIKEQRILSTGTGIILVLFIFIAYILYKGKRKQKIANTMLTEKHTKIINQHEEIQAQAEHLQEANKIINEKNTELSKKNFDITSSINYASKIQNAVLNIENITDTENFFILNKPCDIVSGDFFFLKTYNDKEIIIVADSTGHGVPGAFMSMLGFSFITEIISERICCPSTILGKLRERVKKSLRQEGKMGEQKDGMDMAICIYDKTNNTLQYAGANNSLYVVRKNRHEKPEIIVYRADRQPIGIYVAEKEFKNHIHKIENNDIIYMFTDGYRDQAGGKTGRKLKSKKFREILLSVHDKTLNEQKNVLNDCFLKWKGIYKQTDDILILGKKFIIENNKNN